MLDRFDELPEEEKEIIDGILNYDILAEIYSLDLSAMDQIIIFEYDSWDKIDRLFEIFY